MTLPAPSVEPPQPGPVPTRAAPADDGYPDRVVDHRPVGNLPQLDTVHPVEAGQPSSEKSRIPPPPDDPTIPDGCRAPAPPPACAPATSTTIREPRSAERTRRRPRPGCPRTAPRPTVSIQAAEPPSPD